MRVEQELEKKKNKNEKNENNEKKGRWRRRRGRKSAQHNFKGLKCILAPYGLAARIIGYISNEAKESKQTLSEWSHFYPVKLVPQLPNVFVVTLEAKIEEQEEEEEGEERKEERGERKAVNKVKLFYPNSFIYIIMENESELSDADQTDSEVEVESEIELESKRESKKKKKKEEDEEEISERKFIRYLNRLSESDLEEELHKEFDEGEVEEDESELEFLFESSETDEDESLNFSQSEE